MGADESMQPWLGPGWREDSLYSQSEWIRHMSEEKGVHIWVMTSWTKVKKYIRFSSSGFRYRLGSSFDDAYLDAMRLLLVCAKCYFEHGCEAFFECLDLF